MNTKPILAQFIEASGNQTEFAARMEWAQHACSLFAALCLSNQAMLKADSTKDADLYMALAKQWQTIDKAGFRPDNNQN